MVCFVRHPDFIPEESDSLVIILFSSYNCYVCSLIIQTGQGNIKKCASPPPHVLLPAPILSLMIIIAKQTWSQFPQKIDQELMMMLALFVVLLAWGSWNWSETYCVLLSGSSSPLRSRSSDCPTCCCRDKGAQMSRMAVVVCKAVSAFFCSFLDLNCMLQLEDSPVSRLS